MIVLADTEEGDVWLDFTASPFPVGYLPPPARGIDALVVVGEQGTWKTTPEDVPLQSCISSMTRVSIAASGLLSGESSLRYTGDWGFSGAGRFSTKRGADLKDALEDEIHGFLDAVTLDSCRLAFLSKSAPEVTLIADFEDESRVVRVDDKMVVKPDFVESLIHNFVSMQGRTERQLPLVVPFGWQQRDTTSIAMPPGWTVDRLPLDARSRGRYGTYAMSVREKDGRILIVREQTVESTRIPAAKFPDFVDFWTKARRNTTQEIVLKKM
jgi:hypothetical protein